MSGSSLQSGKIAGISDLKGKKMESCHKLHFLRVRFALIDSYLQNLSNWSPLTSPPAARISQSSRVITVVAVMSPIVPEIKRTNLIS